MAQVRSSTAQMEKLEETFAQVSAVLSAQDETREKIRAVRDASDVQVRRVLRALAGLHFSPDMPAAARDAVVMLGSVGSAFKDVENACPKEEGAFFQYHDIWRNGLQQAAYVAVVLEFLLTDGLATQDRVVEMLGSGVRLPLEDYLWGVCHAVSELPRLAMNRVTLGDYETPRRNAQFAANVFDAFLQCNFRNDFLRKKYDGMKYEVKKLEELIYDLSVRGLLKSAPSAGAVEAPIQSDGAAPAAEEAV